MNLCTLAASDRVSPLAYGARRGLRSTLTGVVVVPLVVATLGCPKPPPPTPPAEPAAPPPVVEAPPVAKPQYPEPPAPSQPRPVQFPEATSFALDNGLFVYVVENHEVPIVSAELVIRVGDMDDDLLAGFTAGMLGEGTKSRTKAQVDAAIESVGGSLWSSSGMHTTTVSSTVLTEHAKLALSLIADEVMNASLPKAALEKLRKQTKTGIDASKASPSALASRLLGMVAYPKGHPYGRNFPTDAAIDAVTLEAISKFRSTFFRSNNAFLILSGDVTVESARALATDAFGKWTPADPKNLPPNPLNAYKEYELPKGLVFHIVDRPSSAQSEILVGNLSISRKHEDWIKLEVANAILGEDVNGRLFQDIREKRGLAYGIGSTVSRGQSPGLFYITTRTENPKTGDMMAAIFEHTSAIRKTPVEAKELEVAIRKLVGSFPLQIETAGQIGGKVRETLVYGLAPDYWKTYRDDVTKVTTEQVLSVSRDFIHGLPHVVIVGEAKEIEGQLRPRYPEASFVRYDVNLAQVADAGPAPAASPATTAPASAPAAGAATTASPATSPR